MTTPPPLDEGHPGDNLELVRDLIAVTAAAVQCPTDAQWMSLQSGLIRILGYCDDILKWEAQRATDGGPVQ
jgi:hypothetical protein